MVYQLHRDNEEYFRYGPALCSAHFHRAVEMIYCIRTDKPVTVSGEEYLLSEGELLFVPPLTSHMFPRRPNLHALCVVLPVHYSDLFEEYAVGKRVSMPVVRDKAIAADVFAHLQMLESCTEPPLRDAIYRYALARALTALPFSESAREVRTDLTMEILLYVRAHYREKLTSRSVAAALGYDPCYFSTVFNKQFGTTFPAYLGAYRIERALPMLGKYPIAEIAEKCGFASPQSFYRAFKSVTDTTPSEYGK